LQVAFEQWELAEASEQWELAEASEQWELAQASERLFDSRDIARRTLFLLSHLLDWLACSHAIPPDRL
jgi:hypothetical protein